MLIEVITGGMFSGKTEELLRRCRRVQYANQDVVLFKPRVDDRYSEESVVSHAGVHMDSALISHVDEIWETLEDGDYQNAYKVVAIDEAQFIEGDLLHTCQELARHLHRVIVAGLDMNSDGEPFRVMADLMAVADKVTKLRAVCIRCGSDATFSYFKGSKSGDAVHIGGAEAYEARCRACFYD